MLMCTLLYLNPHLTFPLWILSPLAAWKSKYTVLSVSAYLTPTSWFFLTVRAFPPCHSKQKSEPLLIITIIAQGSQWVSGFHGAVCFLFTCLHFEMVQWEAVCSNTVRSLTVSLRPCFPMLLGHRTIACLLKCEKLDGHGKMWAADWKR